MTTTHKLTPMAARITLAFIFFFLLNACKKNDFPRNPGSPNELKSEVIEKWMAMQLRLMKNTAGVANHAFSRHYAYSGIACWEAIAPGIKGYGWVGEKWNGLNGLPIAKHHQKFYWPANANAALASINRLMFPNAGAADKNAIDSLENFFTRSFQGKADEKTLEASVKFGRETAQAVFSWSQTDGAKDANAPYEIPTGDGLWKRTPPAFAAPATPYWGKNRPVVAGSTSNVECPSPTAYSIVAGSPFFTMVKAVHDASKTLTDDQKKMAEFWRDIPGVSSPGHWLSILHQTVAVTKPSMAKAALAYALSGSATNDALIACFRDKYKYCLVRPVTYVQEIAGDVIWAPYMGTPAHPEYPSAHSALSAGAAEVLEHLFGDRYAFTDHTYDYMGFSPRVYSSFAAAAHDAGLSRFYGGIHYMPSVDAGLHQGRKVGANILGRLSAAF